MDKSLFRSWLGVALLAAISVSSSHAQDGVNGPVPRGNIQAALEAAVSPIDQSAGNSNDAFHICLTRSSPELEFNASLLFLQPLTGNLVYATLVNPFPLLTPHWTDQAVRPGFTPAFNVGARYNCGFGGDVQLAWTHLNSYDADSAFANPNNYLTSIGSFALQSLAPQFLIGPPPQFTNAHAIAHVAYDAVNLDAGLLVSAGNHVQLRILAGLQGARISQNLCTYFQGGAGPNSFTTISKSVFTGMGPRLGMDLHYLAGNLDLLCGIAGSTLIGHMESRIDFFTASPTDTAGALTPNSQFVASPGSTRLIPGIDARMGAGYAIPLGTCGLLKCEAGYQAAAYIDAVNQYSLTEVANPFAGPLEQSTAGVFLRSATEFQSNFVVHGPYLKFAWQF